MQVAHLLNSREPAAKEWGDGGTPSRIRRPFVCSMAAFLVSILWIMPTTATV